jgi:hypothetical protein
MHTGSNAWVHGRAHERFFAPAENGVTKITVLCSPDPTIRTEKRSGRVFIILQAVAADDLDRDPHFPLS